MSANNLIHNHLIFQKRNALNNSGHPTQLPPLFLIWSLLLGVALISIGSGMQGTLLGLRASLEDFSIDSIGFIMSVFYIGFLLASRVVPGWVRLVGHIRVFAALGSIASVAILLHSTIIDPAMWSLFRMLTGFCLSGLYMVSESWLNAITGNANRGRLLAAHMFTTTLGFIGGQFLTTLASPLGFELFIITSVVLSVSIVPMLLSGISAPSIAYAQHMKLSRLIRLAPLGTLGVFVHGLTCGAVVWLTAVFGQQSGFSAAESALMVGILLFGGLVLMLPVGRLSDRQDRRRTLLVLSVLAICASLLVPFAAWSGRLWLLVGLLFLIGGTILPFYSVSISFINDHVRSEQILSVSGSIFFISGFGGLFGPLLSSQAMKFFGPGSLFIFIALFYMLMAAYTVYRMSVRAPISAEDQSQGTVIMMQTSQVIVTEAMDETDQGDPLALKRQGTKEERRVAKELITDNWC